MATWSSRKVLTGAVAGLVVIGGLASSEAEARSRHRGAAVAAGIIGGLALGAIAASAARPAYAAPSYGYHGGYYPSGYGYQSSYYGGGYGGYGGGYYAPVSSHYAPSGGYYEAAYDDAPVCFWTRRRMAIDPYTVVIRRVRVCQ